MPLPTLSTGHARGRRSTQWLPLPLMSFLATLFITLGLTGAASAATTPYNEKDLARGLKEAPAVVAAANIPCDVTAAAYVGTGTTNDAGGKPVKGDTYEVACKSGLGLFIIRLTDGKPGLTFNCNQAESYNKLKPSIAACKLPQNTPNYTWLTPVVSKVIPGCVVAQARWLGEIPDSKITRYEVKCESKAGGVVDVPNYDNPDQSKLSYRPCLQVASTPSKCEFTTDADAIASLKPQIAKASADCQVNNLRYVGAAEDQIYYEVGCANKAGFILITTLADAYKGTASCDRAANIGGCKFTDTAAVSADVEKTYATLLAKGGFPCTVKEYNVMGTQTSTKRDLVEFTCPEQPWGLIGFVPAADSTASLDVFDCYTAQARKRVCEITTEETLFTQIGVMAKATDDVKKDCVVQKVRYVGMNEENKVIVEIACVNKRGYLATINTKRTAFEFAQPCTVAKKYAQKCEIPGNGTYVLQ